MVKAIYNFFFIYTLCFIIFVVHVDRKKYSLEKKNIDVIIIIILVAITYQL